jgi:beta-lactamase regulating signal transducer with metallopeptidase domain
MNALGLDALFEALANGMWRGSLLVAVAAVLLRLMKTTAAERYAAWLAVLAVIALAPVTEALLSWTPPAAPEMEIVLPSASALETASFARGAAAADAPRQRQAWAVSASPFLLLWSVVGLALVVRLWRRCSLAARLKRRALLPDTRFAVALEEWETRLASRRVGFTRVTDSLRSPAAVGWVDPAVLLPIDEQENADCQDLEMLWRHEQAHIARRDDWTQLFSECLFAVAWFHPAAHWVRWQLERERELACDETVVNSGVEASRYAGALGRWAERAATNELAVGVIGLGRSRALIIRRIEMLLSPSRILRQNGGRWAFAGSFAAALGASFLLAVSVPLVIRAQVEEAPVAVDLVVPVQPEVEITVPVKVTAPRVSVEPVRASQAAPPALALSAPQPVLVQPKAELEIVVPVKVTAPRVFVEPALVSQAAPPAPPAPPAPQPVPAPARAAVPAPPAPPAPPAASAREGEERSNARAERAQRWREEMQPHIEAIQQAAKRMRDQVQAKMGPQREKLQALAEAIAEEHAKSIQPLAQEMAALGAQMAAAGEAQREELAAQMDALAKQMKAAEPEFRRLEEEMSKIEIDMRPFEEEMKKFQEDLREKQRMLQEAERNFKESAQPNP